MSEGAIAVASEGPEIPCLLVPLLDNILILPTVSVAEMASMHPLTAIDNAPPWLLGYYEWRNIKVPVVSYEGLNGGSVTPLNPQGRMAVLNNTGVDERLAFVAIPTQGIPRMVRIHEKDIVENTSEAVKAYDDMHIKLGLEEFTLPNIAAIEKACLETGILVE
ncbi:chemotaxis protein CheW [Teredinibacter purpureus]|jgi:CheW-like domain.|uniref:chemotaxis protein CheW n=1 Tax=Teredinibacter purpureus TaxID=2731756 RepID=UPI0005F8833B|nr:chemotaxis protein CheW [Teredinibacter purpureus]